MNQGEKRIWSKDWNEKKEWKRNKLNFLMDNEGGELYLIASTLLVAISCADSIGYTL